MVTSRFIALGLGLAIAATACSSATSDTTPAATEPKPVCPNFVSAALAAGTTCTSEGYVCGIGFQCGPFFQQAACTCTGGKFVCTSPKGDIPAGTSEADVSANFCTAQPPSTEACPSSVTAQANKKCLTPGKACFYTGLTCQGETDPLTDRCACTNIPSGDGGLPVLSWVCQSPTCTPTAR